MSGAFTLLPMKYPIHVLLALILSTFCMNSLDGENTAIDEALAIIEANPTQEPPLVLLKLDDICVGRLSGEPYWKRVADFAREQGIKVNFGIIATGLDKDSPEAVEYRNWMKQVSDEGIVEYWNHGLNHKRWETDGKSYWEFRHSGYEYQKEHLEKVQQLVQEQLGITMVSFGAPYNAVDEQTAKVLKENTDITVWLYGNPKYDSGKLILERFIDLETPVHNPNFEAFVIGYAQNMDKPYYVLQGHPNSWDSDERWENFVKIIEFLKGRNAVFVTSSEIVDKLK